MRFIQYFNCQIQGHKKSEFLYPTMTIRWASIHVSPSHLYFSLTSNMNPNLIRYARLDWRICEKQNCLNNDFWFIHTNQLMVYIYILCIKKRVPRVNLVSFFSSNFIYVLYTQRYFFFPHTSAPYLDDPNCSSSSLGQKTLG